MDLHYEVIFVLQMMGKHLVGDPQLVCDDPCSNCIRSVVSYAAMRSARPPSPTQSQRPCCAVHIFVAGPAERCRVTTSSETTFADRRPSALHCCEQLQ